MSTAQGSGAGGYGQGNGKRRKMSRRRFELLKRNKAKPFQPEFHGLEKRLMPTVYTVTNTSSSGAGSLAAAITGSDSAGVSNVINFDITTGSAPYVISLPSGLPTVSATVSIEGNTQPGYTNAPLIELDGTGSSSGISGLYITASHCVIDGLVISGFASDGIVTSGNDNSVFGCYIGTNAGGNAALANAGYGVDLFGTATGNTIGAIGAGLGNLISGNSLNGVYIDSASASGNVVANNDVGINVSGTALGNGDGGITIDAGTNNTIIENVVSGNTYGIVLEGSSTTENSVIENLVGVVANGGAHGAVPNSDGVLVQAGATGNSIGGSSLSEANVISGNSGSGINIGNTGTAVNQVEYNYIGTDPNNDAGLGNAAGIFFYGDADGGPTDNTIGPDNIISGNTGVGITINNPGTSHNLVIGNLIGTKSGGASAMPNSSGVLIQASASDNTIGGSTAALANVISGNTNNGVWFQNSGTTGNVVLGNFIGTNGVGLQAVANNIGVNITGGTTGNTIGGNTAGAGNVISGNTGDGVEITGSGTSGNVVAGNLIGTDVTGTVAIPNYSGVKIDSGATGNLIGTNGDGVNDAIERNIISGNLVAGVLMTGTGTANNVVAGNYIGTTVSGDSALGNGTEYYNTPTIYSYAAGIVIVGGASSNLIGTNGQSVDDAGEGNLISGSANDGIDIGGAGTTGNTVAGNYIGTNAAGTTALANQDVGVSVEDGATSNVIGSNGNGTGDQYKGNLISGNALVGVQI